jgi:hypothetical protein
MIITGYQTISQDTGEYIDTIFEEHELDADVLDSMERLTEIEQNNTDIFQFFFAHRLSPDEYKIYAVVDK